MAEQNQNLSRKRTFGAAFGVGIETYDEVRVPLVKSMDMNTKDVIPYFEEYGEVESVDLTIRFKNKNDANSVVRDRHHMIGNHIFKAATSTVLLNNNDAKIVAQLPKQILDLGDECLMNIFSFLNDECLIKIGKTCARFNTIAEQAFFEKHKGRYCIFLSMFDKNWFYENVFKHFGSTIDSLTIWFCANYDDDEGMNSVLELAAKYCGHKSQASLDLDGVKGSSTSKTNSSIALTSGLKELNIEDGESYRESAKLISIVTDKFPNLEKFSFFSRANDIDKEMMEQLCKLKLLKHLEIESEGSVHMGFLNGLVKDEIPLLETLILDCPGGYCGDINGIVRDLSKLKQIKVLYLTWLEGVTDDHLVHLVKSLQMLNQLLCYGVNITINGLKKIIRHGHQLTMVHFTGDALQSKISVADYEGLVKMVKQRQRKKKLMICFPFDTDISDTDADLARRNEDDLEICHKWYDGNAVYNKL